MADLKKLIGSQEVLLWALAFTAVSVLVGLGKLKPETLEFMLFALVGRASNGGKVNESSDNSK